METADQVYEYLNALGIEYARVSHPPVETIADCLENDRRLGAVTAKNYFLATKNLKNFYLCLTGPDARLKSSDISAQLNSARLHFAPQEALEALLHVKPGAVSPMGLIFDAEHRVQLAVDLRLKDAQHLAFHPCVNTQTLAMQTADFFEKFLPSVGCDVHWIEIHDFLKD